MITFEKHCPNCFCRAGDKMPQEWTYCPFCGHGLENSAVDEPDAHPPRGALLGKLAVLLLALGTALAQRPPVDISSADALRLREAYVAWQGALETRRQIERAKPGTVWPPVAQRQAEWKALDAEIVEKYISRGHSRVGHRLMSDRAFVQSRFRCGHLYVKKFTQVVPKRCGG